MAKQIVEAIRVITTESESDYVRARALKVGAVRVSSRTVSPNQVESFAFFSKAKQAVEFSTWLQKKYRNCIVDVNSVS